MNSDSSPQKLRRLIRNGKWTTPASGAASGYLQANLVMLLAQYELFPENIWSRS